MSVSIDPPAPENRQSTVAGRDRTRANSTARTPFDPVALRNRVYASGDLASYSKRDRLIIRAADLFFSLLIRGICSTLRWETRGLEHLDSILSAGRLPIFTFWHTCILSATWFWRDRGIVVMSSVSRDAEYTGRVIKRFGYGTTRGSSTRGGGRALAEMAHCLDQGMEVAFTIDGPRGPAYIAKPGAVTLARHSGQPILPFHIAAKKWRLSKPSFNRRSSACATKPRPGEKRGVSDCRRGEEAKREKGTAEEPRHFPLTLFPSYPFCYSWQKPRVDEP